MSTHRGPARSIPTVQLVLAALAVITLVVAFLLGQEGSGGSSNVAETCRAGSAGSAGSPAECPTAAPTLGAAGGAPTASRTPGPGTKWVPPRPSTETVGGTGAAAGERGGSAPSTTARTGGTGSPSPARGGRPRGGRSQEPVVDLELPPVAVPSCILDCR
ncbi:hypothetical protein UG55_102162 [Frankia sp. EI5c]|uniref:hypothetical protein n=1 Tax=Frankia sp. EI5c TaxID=683316 RepID=UPI0007C296C5|nr:hypothetical protein [Frankia sp. EI5c]OAA25628.1 hypothetical protein UG55_102162 [Frankia sp. EI5c]